MPFNPRTEYTISSKLIPIGDFFRYTDEFERVRHIKEKAFGIQIKNRHF